ncbi:MBL fold metallo-hydrolase [Prevotella sp. kh1p2]|jgi:glyoxylase-like metal-dependent hydrolase (beta-lactamase superfamily II)|uniref:MBL fold metallo-hydrolase n=1 Tax=Prevotella sp. kh1p2 TaxID=1761883 RepID=UPI0008CB0A31|nr:MBL fold metallo-hydrolase [Prevotella sp. kh1p2]SET19247.1 Glyoxylase, beta-lactamase superfamily II [Prevotella sp. kh1p2]SNU12214.1 Glyoxylase, beta-lactamase superfamily II [Prevotellaceae bacterium KH2P17]
MLKIQKFVCNMIQENCYVVSDDTLECVIIDCGAFYPDERAAIVDYIRQNNLLPKHLLATHGHIDHNFGNNTIYELFGLKPEVYAEDEYLMTELPVQAEAIAGVRLDYAMPPVGKYLQSDDVIRFGTHELTVLPTPGHSKGSVFFYCQAEHVAFSGDTLFYHSIGRTDFEGGSMFQMIQSLRMISQLPDDTIIYPGHGEETTIGAELAGNPYMDR